MHKIRRNVTLTLPYHDVLCSIGHFRSVALENLQNDCMEYLRYVRFCESQNEFANPLGIRLGTKIERRFDFRSLLMEEIRTHSILEMQRSSIAANGHLQSE